MSARASTATVPPDPDRSGAPESVRAPESISAPESVAASRAVWLTERAVVQPNPTNMAKTNRASDADRR